MINFMKLALLLFVTIFIINVNGFRIRNRRDSDAPEPKHKSSGSDNDVKFWGYRKGLPPKEWHKHNEKCKGQQQSPINIKTSQTIHDPDLQDIVIQKTLAKSEDENSKLEEYWTFNNNGHGVNINPKNVNYEIKVDNETYRLLQMHFHWRGSEHLIDDHKYAAELHLVHQNLKDDKKYTVLGIMFKISNEDNNKLTPIIEKLKDVVQYNSQTKSESLKLEEILPTKYDKYFRYPGSLTTPNCDEIVEWHVVGSPILTISEDQLLEFQSLEDKHGHVLLTNSRPVQEMNRRLVRSSFNAKITSRQALESSISSSNQNILNKFLLAFSFVLSIKLLN